MHDMQIKYNARASWNTINFQKAWHESFNWLFVDCFGQAPPAIWSRVNNASHTRCFCSRAQTINIASLTILVQVAGMLFAKQAQLQLPGEEEEDGNRPFKPRWGISWDASKVQKLGQQQLSQAAIQSLEVALQQYEQPPCPLLHMTCSMRAQHSSLIKSQGAKSEQVQSAQSQLQQCFARLRELGCS